jgi:CRP-like cAMP-binding protein
MTATFDGSIIAPQLNPTPSFETFRSVYPCRELTKGESLYHTGDQADTVYRIKEGLVKVSIDLLTGKERIVHVAGPGDFVGAISPSQSSFQDSAEAISPRVVVQVIPQSDIKDRLKDEVFNAAGVQLSRLREALEDSELPVTARLARTFVRLGERFGHISDDQTVHLTLPLTHDNFAAMVGAARETTTALLSEMRDNGLLQGTRGRYSFNLSQLNDYAAEAAFV